MTSCIVIPTKDRPTLVKRCIDALLINAVRKDLKLDIFLLDQSSPERFGINEGYLHTCARQHRQHNFFHVSASSLAEQLVAHAGCDSSIRRLLDPKQSDCFGANRNIGLLVTAGRRYLSIDDDVVLDPVDLAVPRVVRATSAETGRPSFLGFHSRSRLDEIVAASELDVLSTCLRAVGASSGDRRLICCPGIVGHTGMGSHGVLLGTVCAGSKARLLASPEALNEGLGSVFAARWFQDGRVKPLHDFMATAYAFDNEQPLVPFFPATRGEDHLFASSLVHCGADFQAAHLPQSIWHLPEHARVPAPVVQATATAVILTACLRSSAAPRMATMAKTLAASLRSFFARADYEEKMREAFMAFAQAQIEFCKGIFDSRVPLFAVPVIERQVLAWEAALLDAHLGSEDLAAQMVHARQCGLDLADLCIVWDALWNAAVERRLELEQAFAVASN